MMFTRVFFCFLQKSNIIGKKEIYKGQVKVQKSVCYSTIILQHFIEGIP